jgi:hypothetical protein
MIVTIALTIIFLACFLTTSYLIWLFLYVKDYPAPYYPPVVKPIKNEINKISFENDTIHSSIQFPPPMVVTPAVQVYYYPPPNSIAFAIAEYSPPSYEEIIIDDNDTIES